MRALAPILLVAAALIAAIAAPAFAARIAFYRAGAGPVAPGSLEDPGTYGLGVGFNLGVSLPFMHRLAATLDIAHDRLRWEDGSESETGTRGDLGITSVLLGVDVAFRRGNEARPLVTAGLGMARVDPGDGQFVLPLGGENGSPSSSDPETVFAMSAAAGLRLRGPWWPGAVRMTIGWMGLAREEFAHVVPLRVQVEF